MPFGLTNAPATYQYLMDTLFQGMLWNFVTIYLDDILIYSKNFEEHLEHLAQVFEKLRKANIKLKWEKCNFGVTELSILGHRITVNGITVLEDNVRKI